MNDESISDHEAAVERLMRRLHDFVQSIDLDEAKARQIVGQVITDMPLHTEDERAEWVRNWMRAAAGF